MHTKRNKTDETLSVISRITRRLTSLVGRSRKVQKSSHNISIRKFLSGMIAGGVAAIIMIVVIAGFAFPQTTSAGLINQSVGSTFGLGTTSLENTVIRIVQWALGLLALVAVIVIMYGGFIWMTAGGNEEKIAQAKKIITRAVVGLIIVLLSWAIVIFVNNAISNATNPPFPPHCSNGIFEPGLGETGLDCGGPCPACGIPGTNEFVITEFQDSNGSGDPRFDVHLCTSVQTLYNRTVDGGTVAAAAAAGFLQVVDLDNGGAPVPGTWATVSKSTIFTPNSFFTPTTNFQVQLPKDDLKSLGLPVLGLSACDALAVPGCDDSADPITWPFTTGVDLDVIQPSITATYPISDFANPSFPDRNVPMLPVIDVQFSESIRMDTIIDGANPDHPIPGNFWLRQYDAQPSAGGAVVASYGVDDMIVESTSKGFRIRLNSAVPLEAFTWYEVSIGNVTDLCNNPMLGNGFDAAFPDRYAWEFETNDSAPGVGSWYPEGPNQCPDTHIFVVFNTTMYYNKVTIDIPVAGISVEIEPEFLAFPNYSVNFGGAELRINDIVDPTIEPVNNHFRVFELIPNAPLALNTTFDVNVTTDMIIDIDGNLLTHSWSFDTSDAESCACAPFITSIAPNQGLSGECVTISGTCFAGTAANPAAVTNVTFDGNNAIIGGSTATQVTTTVPQGFFVNGDRPIPQVEITYVDPAFGSLTSNNAVVDFFVNGDGVANGPCLFSVNPTAGIQGQPGIVYRGIRFDPPGNATRNVWYDPGVFNPVNPGVWTDVSAITNVHPGATEMVCNQVYVENDVGQSNPLCFDVVPPPPDQWHITNWGPPSCEDICGTPNTFIFSDKLLDPLTITTNNAKVFECADAACDEAGLTDLNLPVNYIPMGGGVVWFTLPGPGYSADTWHRVTFVGGPGGVLSSLPDHEELGSINSTFAGDPAFSWVFKVRPVPSECVLESVALTPAASTKATGQTETYLATPYGAQNCVNGFTQLDSTRYIWTWSSAGPEAVVQPATSVCVGGVNNGNLCNIPANCLPGGVCEGMNIRTFNAVSPTFPASVEIRGQAQSGLISKTGTSDLTIYNCDSDDHCRNLCPYPGNLSQCNDVTKRCTPWVESVNPVQGPAESFMTVRGCYFGNVPGVLDLIDGFNAPHPADVGVCGGNSWTNSQIVAGVPDVPVGIHDLRVTTSVLEVSNTDRTYNITNLCFAAGLCIGGADAGDSCEIDGDCDSNNCTGNVPIPGTGMPGICSLAPAAQFIGQGVTINGDAINIAGAGQMVEFDSTPTSIQTNTLTGPGVWNASTIDEIEVPNGADTGPLRVIVDGCPSNSLDFGVACNNDAQCGAGECCKSNKCVDEALCAPGGVESLCQIVDNPATVEDPENPNCAFGPGVPPGEPGDYDCISNTGDRSDNPPPPPAFPDASYGDDCRFCCIPGNVSAAGLDCFENQGLCDTANRGLYCGCTNDAQCGNPAIIGCGDPILDPMQCCHARPTIIDRVPTSPPNIECINQAIHGTFSQPMSPATIDDTNIRLLEGGAPVPFVVRRVGNNGFAISKDGDYLTPGLVYTVQVDGPGGVQNRWGVEMAANDSWQFTVDANADLCQIARLQVMMNTSDPPMNALNEEERLVDIFRCKGNPTDTANADDDDGNGVYDCIGDQDVGGGANGNQHYFIATPIDGAGNELDIGDFVWTTIESGPDVVTLTGLAAANEWFATNSGEDGVPERVLITADGTANGVGRSSSTAQFRTFICNNPWPSGDVTQPFPFTDQNVDPHRVWGPAALGTNFSFFYCRDRGDPNDTSDDLPAILFDMGTWPSGQPNVQAPFDWIWVPVTGEDRLTKQFLFFTDEVIAPEEDASNALGVRVMENYGYDGPINHGLALQDWFARTFPSDPAPTPMTVDGYEAGRGGRTVYVAATNLVPSVSFFANYHVDLMHRIYIISYPQNATEDTKAIYDRLLESWTFNTNIEGDTNGDGVDDKEQIQRDTKRIHNIESIETKLLTYKSENGAYPLLQGGSYLNGQSTSRWPSWSETLGSQIGSIPIDPQNEFSGCPAGYDEESCWREEDKRFECQDNSRLYHYDVDPDGQGVRLYASLEDPLNWWARAQDGTAIARNSLFDCSIFDGSDCTCYNYQNVGAGTPFDRTGPNLTPVYIVCNGGTNDGNICEDDSECPGGGTCDRSIPIIDGTTFTGTLIDSGAGDASGIARVE
ncbi:Ig-like domain-containing protein, partial [Patescibacteria group bacterium]